MLQVTRTCLDSLPIAVHASVIPVGNTDEPRRQLIACGRHPCRATRTDKWLEFRGIAAASQDQIDEKIRASNLIFGGVSFQLAIASYTNSISVLTNPTGMPHLTSKAPSTLGLVGGLLTLYLVWETRRPPCPANVYWDWSGLCWIVDARWTRSTFELSGKKIM